MSQMRMSPGPIKMKRPFSCVCGITCMAMQICMEITHPIGGATGQYKMDIAKLRGSF